MNQIQLLQLHNVGCNTVYGYLVELERSETGIFVNIPINVLNNAGLSNGMNKVEVWRNLMEL